MLYFDKRIRYLHYYENEVKLQTAGYVNFQVRDQSCLMNLFVRGPRLMGSGEGKIYLEYGCTFDTIPHIWKEEGERCSRVLLGEMQIRNGQGAYFGRFDALHMANIDLRYDQVCGIYIMLTKERILSSRWVVEHKMPPDIIENVVLEPAPIEDWEQIPVEPIRLQEQDRRTTEWDKLKESHDVVHPFGEEEYLKLDLSDLTLFQKEQQKLAQNSFLLHGYYNYKYLILGKRELGEDMQYYLGVPGIYHEREQAIAIMFGFETFVGNNDSVKRGDFGCYFRRLSEAPQVFPAKESKQAK